MSGCVYGLGQCVFVKDCYDCTVVKHGMIAVAERVCVCVCVCVCLMLGVYVIVCTVATGHSAVQ